MNKNDLKRSVKKAIRNASPNMYIERKRNIQKYIFIITYGRSGSTLLQRVIGDLPGSHITGENSGIPFYLAKAYDAARVTEELYARYGHKKFGPWYGADKICSEIIGKKCAKLIYDHMLRPPRKTRILGFKEIRWLYNDVDINVSLDFLERFFSPAYFVFNIRDPKATSESGWWADMPSEETIDKLSRWREQLIAIADQRQNSILMDYDSFSIDSTEFKYLFEFIDEPYDKDYINKIVSERLTHMANT